MESKFLQNCIFRFYGNDNCSRTTNQLILISERINNAHINHFTLIYKNSFVFSPKDIYFDIQQPVYFYRYIYKTLKIVKPQQPVLPSSSSGETGCCGFRICNKCRYCTGVCYWALFRRSECYIYICVCVCVCVYSFIARLLIN